MPLKSSRHHPAAAKEWDDLVKREGLYHKKFTDVPLTVEGTQHDVIGQLMEKGTYKNGKQEGERVSHLD